MNLRKQHRYVAVAVLLPLLFITVTGVLLLLRNQLEWIQPKTLGGKVLEGEFLRPEEVLRLAGPGVEQIIYRPGKNNISVRMDNTLELQFDARSGELMKSAPRRSGLLIDIHQGSWLGPFGQYVLHLLAGLGLLFLCFSGIFIWPLGRIRKK